MTKPTKPSASNRQFKTTPPHQDSSSQNDIYARITGKIITDLEHGNLTWRKP